jgi:hypothetical protein
MTGVAYGSVGCWDKTGFHFKVRPRSHGNTLVATQCAIFLFGRPPLARAKTDRIALTRDCR